MTNGGTPVDELELVRRFYGEVPRVDDAARDRALARIRRARRSRAPRRIALLAAALGALTVGAIVVSQLGSGSAASAELRRLAAIAGGHDLAAGTRPVVYEAAEVFEPEKVSSLVSDQAFIYSVRARVETWRAPSGEISRIRHVIDVRFASDADRQAWEATDLDIPQAGEEQEVTIPPGEIPSLDLAELPLEPDAILDQMRSGWWPEPLLTDETTLLALAELLARGDASPQLRQALFEAAASLDGIELLGEATDPLGRPGVGLRLGPDERQVTLVVDPDTSELRSVEQRNGTGDDVITTWQAYTAWGTVDRIGERPDTGLA
jgi:hypothetical protein